MMSKELEICTYVTIVLLSSLSTSGGDGDPKSYLSEVHHRRYRKVKLYIHVITTYIKSACTLAYIHVSRVVSRATPLNHKERGVW